ncbi:MAG TPA: SDR family oxidoreductase [Candidatus Paceibacterota bacterium]
MQKTYLITGGTGLLGSQLAVDLVREGNKVIFLVRKEHSDPLRYVAKALEKVGWRAEDKINIIPVDLQFPSLGILDNDLKELAGLVAGIWHLAADLSFKPANRERVLDTNVGGTRNVISLAEKLKCTLFYVGTAYVHDKHTKAMCKEVPATLHHFDNAYEESKYLAENLVLASQVRHLIFRPSILLSSVDDKSRNMFGYYAVARAIASSLNAIRRLHILLVSRDAVLNLIPVKLATSWMVSLSNKVSSSSPRIYQITNPKPLRLEEVLRATLDGFGLGDLKILASGVWLARTVLYGTSKLMCSVKIFRRASKILSYYTPYLLQTTQFDVTNSRAVLGKEFMRYDINMTPTMLITDIAKSIAAEQNEYSK